MTIFDLFSLKNKTVVVTGAEAVAEAGATRADVTDEPAVASLMDGAVDRYGRLDVVFANAGMSDYYLAPHETSLQQWNDVVASNLTSVFLCAKHAARHMLAQDGGKIIPTASIWGETGADTTPIPACVLQRELAWRPRSAVPGGGFLSEPMPVRKKPGESIAAVPTHRIMEPAELKGTAVYLASAASDAMTGHILTVDLGVTAH